MKEQNKQKCVAQVHMQILPKAFLLSKYLKCLTAETVN